MSFLYGGPLYENTDSFISFSGVAILVLFNRSSTQFILNIDVTQKILNNCSKRWKCEFHWKKSYSNWEVDQN